MARQKSPKRRASAKEVPMRAEAPVEVTEAVVVEEEEQPVEPVQSPPPTSPQPSKMSPEKKRAVIMRFIKVAGYTFIGLLLSSVGYLAFAFLTDAQLPSWVVTFTTITISGAAASIHKSINWKEAGVEAPPPVEVPAVPAMSIPPMSLPTPGASPTEEA